MSLSGPVSPFLDFISMPLNEIFLQHQNTLPSEIFNPSLVDNPLPIVTPPLSVIWILHLPGDWHRFLRNGGNLTPTPTQMKQRWFNIQLHSQSHITPPRSLLIRTKDNPPIINCSSPCFNGLTSMTPLVIICGSCGHRPRAPS